MILDGIEAITFDAAGTLIVPHPSVGEVYARELAGLGFKLEPSLLEERFIASFKALKRDNPGAILNCENWRGIVFSTLDGLTPTDSLDAQFDALWNAFALPDAWRILPEVERSLRDLAKHNLRLFVLSNNDARLTGVLDGLGIGQYFEAVFVSEELGAEKPALQVFQQVEAQIGKSGSSILHVGDSPTEDIEGAINANWRAALVGPKAGTMGLSANLWQAATLGELFGE